MNIIGLICEYNPFHRGHAEQIRRIREEFSPCTIVCIMSGNFVQRGECAIFPKYLRAQAAIREGADLVLELPYPWSCSFGEAFARGAISLLCDLGISTVCFGSESGDLTLLKTQADRMESEEYRKAFLSDSIDRQSESYIARNQRVYQEFYHEPFPTKPNDILGVCYLRAIKRLGSKITPITLKRSSHYSATNARNALRSEDFKEIHDLIPQGALSVFRGTTPIDGLLPSDTVLPYYRMLSQPIDQLSSCDGMTPGLPSRIQAQAMESLTCEDLVNRLISKRDTAAKIRRSLVAGLVGVKREDLFGVPQFTCLLGASKQGCRLLRQWKKTSNIPILTRPSEGNRLTGEAGEQFAILRRADILFASAQGICAADMMRQGPYIENGMLTNEKSYDI